MSKQKLTREILADGSVVVTHQDQVATFKLPNWMQGVSDVLDNETNLVNYLKERGVLQGVIHQGLAQEIINVRAKARPMPTKDDPNPDLDSKRQHEKVAYHVPSLLPKPKATKDDPASAIEALKKAGWTLEDIMKHFS